MYHAVMAQEDRTWLQERLARLENHRFGGPILLIVFVMGVIGGVFTFGKEMFGLAKGIFWKDSDVIAITVRALNATSNLIVIEPICEMEIIESTPRRQGWYEGASVRLIPVGSNGTTNGFQVKPGHAREFKLRIPNGGMTRDLLERQASTIGCRIWIAGGSSVRDQLPFRKDVLAGQPMTVRFDP
jgi:hypothetical protein